MCIECLICDYYNIENDKINEYKRVYFDICKNCIRKPKINCIFSNRDFMF